MVRTKKFSRKREAILRALRGTDSHPSAEWLHQRVKPEFPDLSLGTVYRNLAQFKEEGLAMSVGVVQGQERFDGNTSPHPHFICEACGAVLDIPNLEQDRTLDRLAEDLLKTPVRGHELTFRGICPQCDKAEKA